MSESVEQAAPFEIGDIVTPVGRYVFAQHRCKVVAYQRRRFRAEIEFPDGHRRWYPMRELRKVFLVTESVEQAATVEGWEARAEREAAAILAELGYRTAETQTLAWLTSVVAVGWLQGANYGAHDTLSHVDRAFEHLRAGL